MKPGEAAITLAHAFVGWALCFATIGIGRATTSMSNTLVVHAIGAPIYFAVVAWVYFTKFNYTTPLWTALLFLSFVVVVDFLVVGLLINRSLAMFASPLGPWLPFALIFLASYAVGRIVVPRQAKARQETRGQRRSPPSPCPRSPPERERDEEACQSQRPAEPQAVAERRRDAACRQRSDHEDSRPGVA